MPDDVRRDGTLAVAGQLPWLVVVAVPWTLSTGASGMALIVNLAIPLAAVALATPLLTRYQRRRIGIPVGGALWRWAAGQYAYHLAVGPLFATALVCTLPSARSWRTIAATDRRWAELLLAPSTTEELERRLEQASAERAAAVEGGLAERRRLERDLHDGVQQGLVAVAVELALLRNRYPSADPELLEGLAAGTDRVNGILGTLRAVVRGIRPPILDERGLDAAISGLVAAVPVPVSVRADLAHRLPEPAETAAYFVISEALTNVVKHASASRVQIDLVSRADGLRVLVRDDGRGGASVVAAGGLSGMVHRVRSIGGSVDVSSPVGGPTTIVAELPCE